MDSVVRAAGPSTGRGSGRLEVRWGARPPAGREDRRAGRGHAGPAPSRRHAVGDGERPGQQATKEQGEQAPARVRALGRGPQRRGTVRRRGRLHAERWAARRQLVGRTTWTGGAEGARPERPEQHGKDHQPPGGLPPPVRPHGRPTVPDVPPAAKRYGMKRRGKVSGAVHHPVSSASGRPRRVPPREGATVPREQSGSPGRRSPAEVARRFAEAYNVAAASEDPGPALAAVATPTAVV